MINVKKHKWTKTKVVGYNKIMHDDRLPRALENGRKKKEINGIMDERS